MNKKNFFIITVLSFIAVIFLVSMYCFFLFFLPLKNNNELFPVFDKINLEKDKMKEVNCEAREATLGCGEARESALGYTNKVNQKKEIIEDVKNKFGISINDLNSVNKNIFFIDGREPEEFLNAHLNGAKNLRAPDIDDYNKIKELFNLNDAEFKSSFFIIYCHDGTRSSDVALRLGFENIKFLVEGVDVFSNLEKNSKNSFIPSGIPSISNKIRDKDFTVDINKANELFLDKENIFLDGRLYKDEKIDYLYDFRINLLSSEEYDKRLKHILQYKDKEIVYMADIYTDLFYAKLLIQRLEKNYGFDGNKFHVLFNQSKEFYQLTNR